MKKRFTNRAMPWSWYFLMLIAMCLLPILLNVWLRHQPEPSSVLAGLHGGTVLILRFPSQTVDAQQIWIRDDGLASRGNIYSGSRRTVHLTPPQLQSVNMLRESWCAVAPQFTASRTADVAYELGLLCSTFSDIPYKQFEIPADQLPAPLSALLTSVPAP